MIGECVYVGSAFGPGALRYFLITRHVPQHEPVRAGPRVKPVMPSISTSIWRPLGDITTETGTFATALARTSPPARAVIDLSTCVDTEVDTDAAAADTPPARSTTAELAATIKRELFHISQR